MASSSSADSLLKRIFPDTMYINSFNSVPLRSPLCVPFEDGQFLPFVLLNHFFTLNHLIACYIHLTVELVGAVLSNTDISLIFII